MLDPTRPALVWFIWPYLSWVERLVFLALCGLVVYSLVLAVTVVLLQKAAGNLDYPASVQKSLLRVRKHVGSLQQATAATFYLFGFVLFAQLLFSYRVIENGSTPFGLIVVRNFQIHFAFAANVFFGFLVLHVMQWFVANRASVVTSQRHS